MGQNTRCILNISPEGTSTVAREGRTPTTMDPDFDFDLENIRSKEQLRERIDVLRRLDKFLEEALRNKVDPDLAKANISVAAIPLGLVATKLSRL